jgi:hypothetical protein
MSLLESFGLASSLSLRCLSRVDSYMSTYDTCNIGSAISLRCRVSSGSCISVRAFICLGSAASVLSSLHLSCSRYSVLDSSVLGSAFSIRRITRQAKTLSGFDTCRVGSSLSVRASLQCGSSISIFQNPKFVTA